jgi:DNA helicase II / ATP-dependent DNA helicase PcrA
MTDNLLGGLNEPQQQAVQAIDGPVLVLAGPGSGKTRVLTHRIAYLIHEVGVDPFHIMAVTFTNKAAREMRERLDTLIGPGPAKALAVGTFHSICVRILRRDIERLGRERDFAVYDSDDQERLMRRVLRDLNLDEKQYAPRAVHARISSAKNELVSPAEYARVNRAYYDTVVARCYERYQALLRENNALDFDDLLVETVRLFEQHPDVLERYQDRYVYLLVDEYQDTNRAQYVFVKQLAAKRRNLFAVGDEDQGVYGWRGADVRNILQFEKDYPDAQVILLEQNYRSSQSILDVASSVIKGGGRRKHEKNLWTANGSGLQVELHEGFDQNEEARWVAEEINRIVASGDYAYGDCAVMYRTNAQSRALEEALIARSVRYQIVGGTRFYERKEIKDLMAYLRLSYNPYDGVSLGRVLNTPGRGIGERTEGELTRLATERSVPVFQVLRDLDEQSTAFNARTRNALISFRDLVTSLIEARRQRSLPDLIEFALERLAFREYLQREYANDEAEDRWANVLELLNVAGEYINLPQENQLPTFLEEVALVSDIDSMDKQTDVVTCITLHQAKGLEYPVVFLIGLEEGLVPHSRSLDDKDQLDEERRLLYVGATRAKERLYLLYAFRRTSYGRTNTSTPSRFLADIPRELLKRPARRGSAPMPQSSMFTQRSSFGEPARREPPPASRSAARPSERPKPAVPTSVSFFAGQRVRHGTFGEGIVISSKLVEGDEEVTVNFGDRERRLLASFARLERISE